MTCNYTASQLEESEQDDVCVRDYVCWLCVDLSLLETPAYYEFPHSFTLVYLVN